jgi:predicted dehydrogenase
MSRVRLGWIGSGFVGQVAHLANFSQIPGAEIVALAELRPDLGKRVCSRYGIPEFHADYRQLLDRQDIDAVVAVVQRSHTGPIAFDVLAAGKNLLTEKPMAQTGEKAALLVERAAATGAIYAVGYMRRHDPAVQRARQVIEELFATKRLGEVLFVRMFLSAGSDYCNIGGELKTDEPKVMTPVWPTAPEWVPDTLKKGYEHFVNVCGHDINLLRYLMGREPRITHVDYRKGRGNLIAFDFGEFGGAFEWGDAPQTVRWEEGIEVTYERGSLRLDLPPAFLRNCPAKLVIYQDGGREVGQRIEPTFDWLWCFRRQAEAFVENVSAGTESIASGRACLPDFAIIDDIWRRIVSGHPRSS